MNYNIKWWIFCSGMIVMIIGGGIWLLSHGPFYGFYPTEAAALRGEFFFLIGLIGLAVMMFGMLFPSSEKISIKD